MFCKQCCAVAVYAMCYCVIELFFQNRSYISGVNMYLVALYVRMFVARANKVEGI